LSKIFIVQDIILYIL